MAIMPGAVVKIVQKHKKPLKPTQFVLHTAVSNADSLYGYFNGPNTDVCSHFYIRKDGTIEQYVDTAHQAPANRNANASAVSVETWDGGNPGLVPWNAAQVIALVKIGLWLYATHGIPMRPCTSPTSAGWGYHSMWGAPSAWTPAVGKTCPGPLRITQVNTVIAAAVAALKPDKDDFLSALSDAEQREVLDRLRNLDGIVTRSGLGSQLVSLVDGKTKGYLDNYILWADGKLDTIIKKLGG